MQFRHAVQTCTDPSTACVFVCVRACIGLYCGCHFRRAARRRRCAHHCRFNFSIYSIERKTPSKIETIFILLPATECFTKVHTISPKRKTAVIFIGRFRQVIRSVLSTPGLISPLSPPRSRWSFVGPYHEMILLLSFSSSAIQLLLLSFFRYSPDE